LQTEDRRSTKLFRELSRSMLKDGFAIRFRAEGRSMFPEIRDGEDVTVAPAVDGVRTGEVVLTDSGEGMIVHRLERMNSQSVRTRGDSCLEPDEVLPGQAMLGRVTKIGEHSAGRPSGGLRRLLRIFGRP
jgi:phage repressor protein C with HTH and peptisase S24 domain